MAAVRMPSRRPLAPLDSWILVFGEAALAADLIMAARSLRGGCASSRLDHGSPKMNQNSSENVKSEPNVKLSMRFVSY